MIRLALFAPPAQRVLVRARRLARRTAPHRITSAGILAQCTEEPEVSALFATIGLSRSLLREGLVQRGGVDEDDTERLLVMIGIDEHEVRRHLPTTGDRPGVGLTLRRSLLCPLQVTLGSSWAETPFAASGRKVLEVAVWNAKRQRRPAAPLDLLRGVLSDGRDSAARAIIAATDDRGRRLWDELHQLDQGTV